MLVVVTGADGFIGSAACELLESHGHAIRRVVRAPVPGPHAYHAVGDIAEAVWEPVLQGADAIVHLAARAHVLKERDPAAAERAFIRANVHATSRLLHSAVRSGVRRFVFLSSIGVNGASTDGRAFRELDEPMPEEPYARSKLQAEQLIRDIPRGQLEAVIVRPPLVYGPRAKGNFLRMLQLVRSGVPLPLASVRNRRNLVGLRNLCEFLRLSLEHPRAQGETFLIAEPEARSTPEILSALYSAFGMRNRLFQCPPGVLEKTTRLLGLHRQFAKLCSSLEIDASKAFELLDWRPAISFEAEMARTTEWFAQTNRR